MSRINQSSSRLGPSQNVAYNAAGGASTQSSVFGAQTYQIRIVAISGVAAAVGDAVRIAIGENPTAGASSTVVGLNREEYFTVTPGQRIGALSNNASIGSLNVTEIV